MVIRYRKPFWQIVPFFCHEVLCHGGPAVKRMFCLPATLVFTLFFFLIELSGCSNVTSRRSLLGAEDKGKAGGTGAKTVPKEQYDQLMAKYEALVKERGLKKVPQVNKANQMMNQMEKGATEVISGLDKTQETGELVETVDVFGKAGVMNDKSPLDLVPTGENKRAVSGEMVEEQIDSLRKAENLIQQNRFDEALKSIKKMENSPVQQIAVRAKYLWGEILFRQGEYDLAMQIYEEIVFKHAFSGLVLKALGRLIVCSEKLKLEPKRKKYYSILHDFFEEKV